MKRVKLEVIYHVGDGDNERLLHDKLHKHMIEFLCPGRGANADKPHFASCIVSVERKNWEEL